MSIGLVTSVTSRERMRGEGGRDKEKERHGQKLEMAFPFIKFVIIYFITVTFLNN